MKPPIAGGPLRGFRQKEGELPGALNGFLYSILRSTKSQRRAILMNLLKQFDDSARSSLPVMLYLADNLAYIPYTVVDEPLFLIHHIDIMVSVIGCNILQVNFTGTVNKLDSYHCFSEHQGESATSC